jgi:hypothetical protein
MSITIIGCSLSVMLATGASPPVFKEPATGIGATRGAMLLVQSELDYLPASKRPVTLQVDKAQPAVFLDILRKHAGLTIEVQGTLPVLPVVSGSFRDEETKELLNWFARQLRVSFKAEPPNKLLIIPDAPRVPPPAKEAS